MSPVSPALQVDSLPTEPSGKFIPIPKKGNAREWSSCHTTALISQASKVMLKILQGRLKQYVNWELSDVQAGFTKGRGTRDEIANIPWIIEKSREFQKNICFVYVKGFDCVDHNKQWKILKEIGIPDHLTCLLRNLYASQKKQLELDKEQWSASKLEKENDKAVYCHYVYLTYMQSTSCKILGWMKHKLESRFLGEISITSDMQMIPLYDRKWTASWWKWQSRVRKLAKNSAFKKLRSWYPVPSGEKLKAVTGFIFLGSKNHFKLWLQPQMKRCLLLGRKAMTNLDRILQNRDVTLPTKIHIVKATFFTVVM